jgi:hypothetical protein
LVGEFTLLCSGSCADGYWKGGGTVGENKFSFSVGLMFICENARGGEDWISAFDPLLMIVSVVSGAMANPETVV